MCEKVLEVDMRVNPRHWVHEVLWGLQDRQDAEVWIAGVLFVILKLQGVHS